MFPIHEFEERFREILEALDEKLAEVRDDDAEALEELNAEFEDALLLLSDIDPDAGDADEELDDALTELESLADSYRALGMICKPVAEPARRLDMAVQLAMNNLQ